MVQDTSKAKSVVKRVPLYIMILLLWLASIVLGLMAIYYLRELSLLMFVLIGDGYHAGRLVSQVVTIVAGLVWIVVIFGTGEYHFKHAGQRKSWTIFAWTIGIEVFIIALVFLLRLP